MDFEEKNVNFWSKKLYNILMNLMILKEFRGFSSFLLLLTSLDRSPLLFEHSTLATRRYLTRSPGSPVCGCKLLLELSRAVPAYGFECTTFGDTPEHPERTSSARQRRLAMRFSRKLPS